MPIATEKPRLLSWLALLLVIGFLTTIVSSYIVSRNVIVQHVADQSLPLTSDNIYSEIQKDVLRPVFISSLMASDTFLRDWILNGETDITQVTRYLKEVKNKYHTITSFLVSNKTGHYYYADGLLKTVSEKEPRDIWYYRVRNMQAEYETNVDLDMANHDVMTVFINHRVLDYAGNFIGATGVGLTLDTVASLIDSYQTKFHRNIYFVDKQGMIKLTGKAMRARLGAAGRSIKTMAGVATIADEILQNTSNTPLQLEYERNDATVLMNARFIPELDWYLLVEQDISTDVRPLQHILISNLAIGAGMIVLILVLAFVVVNRYQKRLETVAGTDSLTGLLNRQAFEILFQQAILDAKRNDRPLSVILFDIDFFKMVNDGHGHLTGDRVLQEIAAITKNTVRINDIVARWGGEEFLILLKDCPLSQATAIAEKLRAAIANHDFSASADRPLTVSLGVAENIPNESLSEFFARADKVLYQAKSNGRNRTEIAS
jgi:diguanylate cyclase (GGDEF)-like protein